ncbi:unnamed protein product [Sphenostylis stenocarpa]|uniref:Uncharacterized protein n=1 Tax=Sphenostylis stenocarpa TaxID=92480 RepID=A0AA86SXH4_9FABA|nr:unnamed protein product [Sphenostylis stenocarpa]
MDPLACFPPSSPFAHSAKEMLNANSGASALSLPTLDEAFDKKDTTAETRKMFLLSSKFQRSKNVKSLLKQLLDNQINQNDGFDFHQFVLENGYTVHEDMRTGLPQLQTSTEHQAE